MARRQDPKEEIVSGRSGRQRRGTGWGRLEGWLLRPVDAASLATFRIAFGGILAWHALAYFRHDLVGQLWIRPAFHFTYYGFDWVRPWPGSGMYVHLALLALCSLMVAAGLGYRISAALAALGLTYVFLLEQALYLNHVYLLCLVCFLMAVVPAHAMSSVDSWRRPRLRSPTVPRWALLLLQFQIGVVYVYAGLAKLNGDWLAGEPVRTWLFERTEASALETALTSEPVVYLVAYGGLLFDLAVVPLLFWRRTRAVAFVTAVGFHLANAWWFPLGVFPWFMIAATTLLLPPDWPRKFMRHLRGHSPFSEENASHLGGSFSIFGRKSIGVARSPSLKTENDPNHTKRRMTPVSKWGMTPITLLVVYAAVQLLVPFRHHLYPGNVAWTEEGHRFSWRMRVKDKLGAATFRVRLAGGTTEFDANVRGDLTPWQEGAMANRPDMILQFAHHLARRFERELGRPVEVRVESAVSLNARRYQRMIDPDVDLAAQPRNLRPAVWILPLPPDPT